MDEIEVKIPGVSHEELAPKLLSLGAKKTFEGILDTRLFDTDDSKIEKSDEVLRLRKEGYKTFITYKQTLPSDFAKKKKETEVEVSDFETAKELLLVLGFKEIDKFEKKRISYKLDKIKIEFDKFLGKEDFVPEFMEIEAETEKELYKYIEILGFSKEECKNWGRLKMIKHYSK